MAQAVAGKSLSVEADLSSRPSKRKLSVTGLSLFISLFLQIWNVDESVVVAMSVEEKPNVIALQGG